MEKESINDVIFGRICDHTGGRNVVVYIYKRDEMIGNYFRMFRKNYTLWEYKNHRHILKRGVGDNEYRRDLLKIKRVIKAVPKRWFLEVLLDGSVEVSFFI